ncbi:MAG: hypothetical protein Q8M74_02905, partial [Chloroflexota bacterium]|nr:hypothetical protein [Chloroflexota bacterium]
SPDSAWTAPRWAGPDGSRTIDRETITRTAEMLVAANLASVAYRYPDDEDADRPGPVEPDGSRYWQHVQDWPVEVWKARTLSPVETLKALDGFTYQACEHPDWPTSEAAAFCDALRLAVIHRLAGYDAAAWEIDA